MLKFAWLNDFLDHRDRFTEGRLTSNACNF